jgi:hypothetical protein
MVNLGNSLDFPYRGIVTSRNDVDPPRAYLGLSCLYAEFNKAYLASHYLCTRLIILGAAGPRRLNFFLYIFCLGGGQSAELSRLAPSDVSARRLVAIYINIRCPHGNRHKITSMNRNRDPNPSMRSPIILGEPAERIVNLWRLTRPVEPS